MNVLHRIRQFVDERLEPSYLYFVSSAAFLLTIVLAIAQFATVQQGRSLLSTSLGADFSGFYVAAQILNMGHPDRLYDRQLHHQLWHELLPHEAEQTSIPYIHPPFVAGLLQPLTCVSYPVAVAIWLVISATLYLAGIVLLLRSCPWPVASERRLIVLLLLSFEPFAFECWLGGQLSAIAFLSYASCFVAIRRSQPVLAGMALGICFYKPTLLLLTLPLLVIGRRGKILLGMTMTGLFLAGLSIALVGWENSLGYVRELFAFRKSTAGGGLEIPLWKYVDLNNCLRLLLGPDSQLQLPLLSLIGVIPLGWLVRHWWLSRRWTMQAQEWLWLTTLTWVPVLNLYVGIYDSILVVQSALLLATLKRQCHPDARFLTQSGLAYLLVGIYLSPWFSQKLAAVSGVSLYTIILMGLGCYQFLSLQRFIVQEACSTAFPDVTKRLN